MVSASLGGITVTGFFCLDCIENTDTWKEDLIDSLLEKLPEVHEDPAGEHLSQEESSRGRKQKIINYANIENETQELGPQEKKKKKSTTKVRPKSSSESSSDVSSSSDDLEASHLENELLSISKDAKVGSSKKHSSPKHTSPRKNTPSSVKVVKVASSKKPTCSSPKRTSPRKDTPSSVKVVKVGSSKKHSSPKRTSPRKDTPSSVKVVKVGSSKKHSSPKHTSPRKDRHPFFCQGQSYADDLVEEVASGVVPQELLRERGCMN
ncbi:hypothetical protein OS493_030383 [Desmophyllum pertusum]|uniref:Uncharacterized protein n=1 Tax=Desmophyllum pertusum TaxID=174260 RepID=A0A9W9ZAM4_9CNID|nr:hypothetical protein OS493_030383 [Desmophyllum pertusum]